MKIWLCGVLCCLCALALPLRAADEAPKLTVSSHGSSKVTPTMLEVFVTLKEKGDSVQAASDALKAMRESVAGKFKELFKVAPEQIKEDDIAPVDQSQSNYARMQMMRSSSRLKKAGAEDVKKPVIELSQMLHVRIPLTGKDNTALILEAENIKATVKAEAMKLIEKKKEGADDGEANPEGEMMRMQQYDGNQQGPLHFAFFAPAKDDVRGAALEDALRKAKETAGVAAKLVGKTAELHSLMVQSDGSEQFYNNEYMQMSYYNRYGNYRQNTMQKADGIYSQTPTMAVNAGITAVFLLK